MSFNAGGGGGISTASDVALSAPSNKDFLSYDGTVSKWKNSSIVGQAALATQGGVETLSTINATGTTTLNLSNGNIFSVTLTANVTFVFTGATAGKACSFSVYKKQDSTGGRTVTWPTSVKWSGGAPALTTTANSVDILVFESLDGGSTWYGSLVGANFQ